MAEKLRKCAAENKSAKLDEFNAEAPRNLKKIAMNGIENSQKMIENQKEKNIIEKGADSIHSSMEIIRIRSEFKALEEGVKK